MKNIILFATFVLIIIIGWLMFILPTNEIEGQVMFKERWIESRRGYHSKIPPRPDSYCKVLIVKNNSSTVNRIENIRKFYNAKLDYHLALLEKSLGISFKNIDSLKNRLDECDNIAAVAFSSLEQDKNSIIEKTNSDGKYSSNVAWGQYFVFIKSNKIPIIYTKTDGTNELKYKEFNVYLFQRAFYETEFDLDEPKLE